MCLSYMAVFHLKRLSLMTITPEREPDYSQNDKLSKAVHEQDAKVALCYLLLTFHTVNFEEVCYNEVRKTEFYGSYQFGVAE
mgnify:CR=1 FL=1